MVQKTNQEVCFHYGPRNGDHCDYWQIDGCDGAFEQQQKSLEAGNWAPGRRMPDIKEKINNQS